MAAARPMPRPEELNVLLQNQSSILQARLQELAGRLDRLNSEIESLPVISKKYSFIETSSNIKNQIVRIKEELIRCNNIISADKFAELFELKKRIFTILKTPEDKRDYTDRLLDPQVVDQLHQYFLNHGSSNADEKKSLLGANDLDERRNLVFRRLNSLSLDPNDFHAATFKHALDHLDNEFISTFGLLGLDPTFNHTIPALLQDLESNINALDQQYRNWQKEEKANKEANAPEEKEKEYQVAVLYLENVIYYRMISSSDWSPGMYSSNSLTDVYNTIQDGKKEGHTFKTIFESLDSKIASKGDTPSRPADLKNLDAAGKKSMRHIIGNLISLKSLKSAPLELIRDMSRYVPEHQVFLGNALSLMNNTKILNSKLKSLNLKVSEEKQLPSQHYLFVLLKDPTFKTLLNPTHKSTITEMQSLLDQKGEEKIENQIEKLLTTRNKNEPSLSIKEKIYDQLEIKKMDTLLSTQLESHMKKLEPKNQLFLALLYITQAKNNPEECNRRAHQCFHYLTRQLILPKEKIKLLEENLKKSVEARKAGPGAGPGAGAGAGAGS